MTFIADRIAKRTFDPDRGLDLRAIAAGSDGSLTWVIEGGATSIRFEAEMLGRSSISTDDLECLSIGPDENIGIWQINSRVASDKDRCVIVEAMLAAKMRNGFTYENTKWFVKFGHDGELLSE